MADTLFWMVGAVLVVMATSAPMANKENLITANADSNADEGAKMHVVAKRAEEMVYYGNQQNEPRKLPMKKSESFVQSLLKPAALEGEIDEGGSMLVHNAVPVEEDLSARAEVGNTPSEEEKMAEAAKMAIAQVEKSSQDGEEVEGGEDPIEGALESGLGKDESIVNAVSVDAPIAVENSVGKEPGAVDAAPDEAEVDLPEAAPVSKDAAELITKSEGSDSDEADVEKIAEEAASASSAGPETEDNDDENGDDSDVQEFLNELRQEGENNKEEEEEDEDAYDVKTNNMKNYQMVQGNGQVDPNYYQTIYHILANSYRGGPAEDYYNNNYNTLAPYYQRRRRSPLRRRDLASIRRSGHVRRMKRGLPSDWLAAYRGLDIPLSSNDMKDSLISDPEDAYEYDQDDDELSRYIYGNLLNKIANSYSGMDADVEEEIPYEEILPYDLDPEVADSLLGEYEPDELVYDPEISSVYRDDPYDDYVPNYEYSKRSGGGYYPDSSRRKRYFYPVYDEPETHWGAFVPEKRNYDDAIQRLQKLAVALSDNPRPYYERLLRDYRRK